jgi:hypothetical protein
MPKNIFAAFDRSLARSARRLAEKGDGKAGQDRHQQHLQQVAAAMRAEDSCRE